MGSDAALQESDLIFSNATQEIKHALGGLKRFNLSVSNRLRSIYHDSKFVVGVSESYRLPLVANERCGSWYIPTTHKAGSAYFKSTDGHYGQWSFSLRRLNLQILDVLAEHGGCVIVDSTRRGKSMPDALSKTVPIWAAVLNRLLFPEQNTALHLPPEVVSPSEHSQIDALLPLFVAQVAKLKLDTKALRAKLDRKAISIAWETPNPRNGNLGSQPFQPHSWTNLVVLCTASSQSSSVEATGHYVQGAADDAESWALGLTPVTYWQHIATLLSTAEDELPRTIEDLKSVSGMSHTEYRQVNFEPSPICVKPTIGVHVAPVGCSTDHFDCIVYCNESAFANTDSDTTVRALKLQCASGKLGSRQLRTQLSNLCDPGSPLWKVKESSKVLCVGPADYDISVGAALAIICLLCNDDGTLDPRRLQKFVDGLVLINKSIIKLRLSWIMVSMPQARPSRATLQSVNAFLMG